MVRRGKKIVNGSKNSQSPPDTSSPLQPPPFPAPLLSTFHKSYPSHHRLNVPIHLHFWDQHLFES